jgi:hypothetical protein
LGVEVLFVTGSFKAFTDAKKAGVSTVSIYDLVKEFSKEFPDLLDYLGVTNQEFGESAGMDVEEDEAFVRARARYRTSMFEEYRNQDELINGIRRGEIFQGKLNVSRINKEEGEKRLCWIVVIFVVFLLLLLLLLLL